MNLYKFTDQKKVLKLCGTAVKAEKLHKFNV